MSDTTLIVYIILLCLSSFWAVYEVSLILAKRYFDKRTNMLANRGIIPRGSRLYQGMIVDPNNPKQIKAVESPTQAWYDCL